MSRITLVICILISIPVGAVVQSAALSQIWTWFLAPQYGTGPSFAAWFGILAAFTIATRHLATSRQLEDAESLGDIIRAIVVEWAYLWVIVGLTAAIGLATGWIG